ncbi:MAG TPA: metallophosphoesterase [Beijerinckiaceae bacterium]|jgi:predicted MPP superfamily phosphohydrolase
MVTRRLFLRLMQTVAATAVMGGGWALAEPFWLRIQRYAFTPEGWPAGLRLRLVVLTDIHACDPWMNAAHIARLVDSAHALDGDCVLLLGDYVKGPKFSRRLPDAVIARELARLKAPLGVHAVLGNHDWWQDEEAMATPGRLPRIAAALREAGLPVYQNEAVRLVKDGKPFWIVGLGDQLSRLPLVGHAPEGYGSEDLPAALAQVTDDAPVILMAHEPDIFPDVPKRVALTLSGHTHGGQIRLFGWAPVMPTPLARRYGWGWFREDGRDLLVSAGLGCSNLPMRFGAPPEIVMIDLGGRG